MDAYRLFVALHLLTAVMATGLALYLALMPIALARTAPAAHRPHLLAAALAARWPYLPTSRRPQLLHLALLLTLLLPPTGLLAASEVGRNGWFALKVGLWLLALLAQLLLLRRPLVPALLLPLPLLLAAAAAAALWVRG